MKKALLSRQLRWTDAILLVLTVGLVIAFIRFRMPVQSAFANTTEVSLGYIGRSANGVMYVVDEGHSRLIAFDESGQELYRITDPSDDGKSILYIDDLMVDGENLYLSASEWNGMLLDRELILRYDLSGNYLNTLTEAAYSQESGLTNKHRFYGLHREEDSLVWAECREDWILIHRAAADESDTQGSVTVFPYENAFNAVSDLVYDGSALIILNKNGRIERFDDLKNPELLYIASWEGEEDRIPFRIAVNAGNVYFTDIRSGSVQMVDTQGHTSTIVWEDTDSQTVTFSEEGRMLLVGSDGLTVSGEQTETYLTLKISRALHTDQVLFLIISALLIIAAALLLFRLVVWLAGKEKDRSKMVSLVVIGVAALACVIVSVILIKAFRENYMDKIREQLQTTGYVVAADITEEDMRGISRAEDFDSEAYARLCSLMERCFPMSVDFYRTTYCNILRLDENEEYGFGIAYLDQSIGVYFPLDELETSEVVRVYHTNNPVWNDAVLDVSGTYLSVKTPIVNEDNVVIGAVAVGADTSVVEEMISDMERRVILSTVLFLLLFWIISTEVLAFVSQRAQYRSRAEADTAKAVPGHLIHLLVFAVFAAYNLISSFLPVYILRHAEIIPEAWRELAASLPIMVNTFVMGIMSLFCARAVRRLGVRKTFVISMAFSLCGNLLLFFVPGFAGIFAGLFLDGVGVGLITNAIYVALTYLPDEHSRQNGFSVYNAASMSGINFGMILGGILAVNIGQKNVFLVVVLFWALLIVLGSMLAKRLQSILSIRESGGEAEKSAMSTGRFLRSKPIWSFIVLIQNPWILFSGFVFYFVPLFCEQMGYQETIASILLMLYSQTASMLGNSLPDRMEKLMGGRAVYPALLLNIIAIAVFALTRNTAGMIAALLILGTSAAFAKPTQQALFLRQKASQRLGEDKAMGIYNFSENIGESLGPVMFSFLMAGPVSWIWSFLTVVAAFGGIHFAMNGKEMMKREQ